MKLNILQMGEIGVGKTRSLITLLSEYTDEQGSVHRGAGLLTAVIGMEAGFATALGPNMCQGQTKSLLDRIHWVYVSQAAPDWETSRKWVIAAQNLPIDDLTKQQDPNRRQFDQLSTIYKHCSNFVCQGCGAELSAVDTWTDEYALALEGLTGLTDIARAVICGSSPFLSLPKIYGIQGLLWNYLKLVWGSTACTTILNAHIEREVDPLTQQSSLQIATIGQKLAPRLAKEVDEVIIAKHERGKYIWDTTDEAYPLKHRRLPANNQLTPDFSTILKEPTQ